MKRLIAAALAVMLLVSLCCTAAMAAGSDALDMNNQVPVSVTMDKDVKHKYSADIDFVSPMIFTYTDKTEWDTQEYTYIAQDGANGPGWDGPKGIRITNHSDMPISYTAAANVTNNSHGALNIVLGNASGTVEKCVAGDALNSRYKIFTVGVTGIPNASLDGQIVALGAVNIRITSF